jgi:hypothetical protein
MPKLQSPAFHSLVHDIYMIYEKYKQTGGQHATELHENIHLRELRIPIPGESKDRAYFHTFPLYQYLRAFTLILCKIITLF